MDNNKVIKNRRGLMLVLSSPSGAGKTTIARKLLDSDLDITISVSVTTRSPRKTEINGADYIFVSKKNFNEMIINNKLLEYAEIFSHLYGTPSQPVIDLLSEGKDVLFDIDWQGTQALRGALPQDVVSVFILPPSTEELERRLRSRGSEGNKVLLKRIAAASKEITHWAEYDYVIVNNDINESVDNIRSILIAERLKRDRQIGLTKFIQELT